jgi:uncharacterized protein
VNTSVRRLQSCLYVGTVRHRRFHPIQHRFQYRLFLVFLDLDELETAFHGRWLWSTRRPAWAWFRREDHLGDPQRPLIDCVRELASQRLGRCLNGPVRLLTHLRYLGVLMNPVSFYYCFDETGTEVEAVVAEVNNTPWGERHCYVLDWRESSNGRLLRTSHEKEFHVSPFLPMQMRYCWRMMQPGARLTVQIDDVYHGTKILDATLALVQRPINGRTLAAALVQFPIMSGKVLAGIYWQALKLWWKRVPYFPHPRTEHEGRTPNDRHSEPTVT